eukprot:scaffold19786_cov19-Tisochrysis_lutea.AAC.3
MQGCHRKPRGSEGQGPSRACALLRRGPEFSHAPPQPPCAHHALQLQTPADHDAFAGHLNRYFETEDWNGIPGQWWFGGGTDITPCYLVEEDMKHFHGVYKQVCQGGGCVHVV